MTSEGMLVVVLAVLFLAALVRSTFGFGEALVAVPLLAFVTSVEMAAPIAVLLSITVAAVVILQDWRHIHVRSAWWLVIPTFFGIPLGIWLLTAVDEQIVKALLALVIVGSSLYCLLSRRRFALADDRWAWLFGIGAGVLGGAYGMNAPPLVIYGSLRGWTPERFRATRQGYFLPASLVGMAGYWWKGLWTPEVTRYYLLSLPLVAIAIVLGRLINRRLAAHTFVLYVHLGLIAVGTALLVHALRA